MDITLSDEERTVLAELLDRAYRDLRSEIYKTDTPAYEDELRQREAVLIGIMKKLGMPT